MIIVEKHTERTVMKLIRCSIRIVCFLVICVTMFSSNGIAACGDMLTEAAFKGVVGYSNAEFQGTENSCGAWTDLGYQWQCVNYIRRFYWEAGLDAKDQTIWQGNGEDYFGTADRRGIIANANGGEIPPKTNDILCYGPYGVGHVAVVTNVAKVAENRFRVDLVEQNWSVTGAISVYMNYEPTTGTYTIEDRGSYAVQGWLRIPYACELYAQNPSVPLTVHPGEMHTFIVYYKNTMQTPSSGLLTSFGSLDWKDGSVNGENIPTAELSTLNMDSPYFHYIELHSCDINGNSVESWLYPGDGIWISDDRIRVVPQNAPNVGYNQNAAFIFQGKIPGNATPGTYDIYFRPFHATGGYLENWGDMHFTIVVTEASYTVGQSAPVEVLSFFTNAYNGNEIELGNPLSEVIPATSGFGTEGYYQLFENGSIQVHSGSAYIVTDEIYAEWGEHGYATWTGFPISDRYACNSGECQNVEGGFIQSNGTIAEFISTTHPTNLTATTNNDGSVNLNWNNRISTNGLNLYRQGSPVERIATLSTDVNNYTDVTAAQGKPYSYFLSAFNDTSESPYSNIYEINQENKIDFILDTYNCSMWFGGDDREGAKPRNVGVGQSFLLPNNAHLSSVGFMLDRRFDYAYQPTGEGHEATLVLNLRLNDGTIVETQEKIIPSDFNGGWVLFDFDIEIEAGVTYIATCYLKNGESLEFNTGALGYNENLLPDSNGYSGEINVLNGDMEDWNVWGVHPWDFCFQVNGYYLNSTNGGLDSGPWPMFGHDARHSRRSEYDVIDGPILKWIYKTGGNVISSPAISSDGTIYFASMDNYLYALTKNGILKWRFQIRNGYNFGGFFSSPAISSDGTIYVGSDEGVYAINPDGSEKWFYTKVWNDYNMLEIGFSSPVIDDDGTVYIAVMDKTIRTGRGLLALNPDGSKKWFLGWGEDSRVPYSSPAIGQNGSIYIGSLYHYEDVVSGLQSISKDCGWIHAYGIQNDIYSSPSIDKNGFVYFGGDDHFLYSLNEDCSLKWKYETGSSISMSSPGVGSDGTIYFASMDSYLYALTKNGILKWRFQIRNGYSSPAIDFKDSIYVGGDRFFYAINSDGTLKWSFEIDNNIVSSPAIDSDGTIYFGANDGNFYAVGLPGGQGGLYGKTSDIEYQNTLQDVTVSVDDSEVLSNQHGFFGLSLDPGVYNITCSKTGYQTITLPNVVITAGQTTELNVELTTPGPLNITTSELPPADIVSGFDTRIQITGGVYPYTYNVAYGALPPGIVIDLVTGYLTGTPMALGTYTFSIGVTDSQSAYAEREFTIEVTEPLTITSTSPLPSATKTSNYFYSIQATGGTLPYTFVQTTGTLPVGLTLSSTGNLSGTPPATGTYDFTVEVTDASSRTDEKSFHLEVFNPLVITTSRLNDGIVGSAYSQTLNASGGFGDYLWQVYSGTLPTGLSLDAASGVLSGTPPMATYGIIVLAVGDQDGRATYKDFKLEISNPLQILTTTLPNALKDEPFSEAIRTSGGIGSYSFSHTGQLPAGLTLNASTGIISGTPTLAEYTNVDIMVTDSTYPYQPVRNSELGHPRSERVDYHHLCGTAQCQGRCGHQPHCIECRRRAIALYLADCERLLA